jgi:hypothetical protein
MFPDLREKFSSNSRLPKKREFARIPVTAENAEKTPKGAKHEF